MVEKKVLVVEDDEMVRTVLLEGLSGEHEVEAVNDGFAAMVSIWKQKPDIVITDLNMFSLDGISLVKNILSNPANADMKFILISGCLTVDRIQEWKALVKEAVIFPKPFTITEIKSAVQRLLQSTPHGSLSEC